MEEFGEDPPDLVVSRENMDEEKSDLYYHNPEFVRIDGQQTHIWVSGTHFVEDPDGEIAEGQYFVFDDAGIHLIYQIKEVSENDETTHNLALVEFEGGRVSYFPFGDDLELWNFYQITGDLSDTIDTGEVVFLKKVD